MKLMGGRLGLDGTKSMQALGILGIIDGLIFSVAFLMEDADCGNGMTLQTAGPF